jgi:hypothetical protein
MRNENFRGRAVAPECGIIGKSDVVEGLSIQRFSGTTAGSVVRRVETHARLRVPGISLA